ncbi:transcriptional regulator [Kribbella speibonae]|uniref:Transcriptional regulator n=1 Tax=Kribbella speibonae TaxID=1572660 RepID=A0A4R0IU35_9ACTN|nr:transcriptional regulator [Kribbella speibonae]TCC27134.1 transcriptional regulator [Kribbella speibonae]TCC36014.1 transcriptional regulator [Kribbella speibonae]
MMHLVLHAVRLLGFADTQAVAQRFELPEPTTVLKDAEARGWATYSSFAGTSGWSLTEAGRAENERLLKAELTDPEPIRRVYDEFLPLNGMLQQACTDWQLRPKNGDPLAANDHTDAAWDAGVLHELKVLDGALGSMTRRLTEVLLRFSGYDVRFSQALARANAGDITWVDRSDVDSCHRVWFELHEDLLATLNLHRGD